MGSSVVQEEEEEGLCKAGRGWAGVGEAGR